MQPLGRIRFPGLGRSPCGRWASNVAAISAEISACVGGPVMEVIVEIGEISDDNQMVIATTWSKALTANPISGSAASDRNVP